jgi:hypothetical protein
MAMVVKVWPEQLRPLLLLVLRLINVMLMRRVRRQGTQLMAISRWPVRAL